MGLWTSVSYRIGFVSYRIAPNSIVSRLNTEQLSRPREYPYVCEIVYEATPHLCRVSTQSLKILHTRNPSVLKPSGFTFTMAATTGRRTYALYKYDPSLAAAVIFCILFLFTTSLHAFQMWRKRTWFLIPLVVGGCCALLLYDRHAWYC